MSETGASLGGQPRRKFEGAGERPWCRRILHRVGLAAVGFYLLFNHVYVQTTFGHPSGFGVFGSSFGLTLVPLLLASARFSSTQVHLGLGLTVVACCSSRRAS